MQLARILDDVVVRLDGDDARTWLQGQVTADLSSLAQGEAAYALLLSAKGKIVSDMWVLATDPWRIVLPRERADDAIARLERFLVMEDVELEREDRRILSVQGEIPSSLADDPRAIRVDRWGAGVDLLVEPDEQRPEAMADAEAWDAARVRAGRPRIGKDFGDDTLPQEAGLKHAVSFSKGCYVGQEPVVMLEHRGKPPKRLVRFRAAQATEGQDVFSDGKKVGRVTSVAPDGDSVVGLALIARRALEAAIDVGGEALAEISLVE